MTRDGLGRPHLSLVIPAYNERERLGSTISRIVEYLDGKRIQFELLIVDDGSTDGTAQIAAEMLKGRRGRVLTNQENRGKGYSVRRGVLEAKGRWILMTDADLSTPIEEHERLAAEARDQDLDVVFGSRALRDSRVERSQSFPRQWMGKTFNLLMRAITGLPFHDTQCGFKLMDRERVKPLFEQMVIDRFAFDVELLFLCVQFGLRVREFPVVWRNAPRSRVSMLTDPWNMLYDVARLRWRFRRGGYAPQESPPGDG